MAHTAHQDEEQMEELVEDEALLDEHAKTLADLISRSNHFILCTGAGVSTSAGIPDFRGPNGVWTLRAQGVERSEKSTPITKAVPTITHMAIVELLKAGFAKYVVSQNVDGLHLKSGVHPSKISELHGNTNLEVCSKCNKYYLRDYPVRTALHHTDHFTGRTCDVCNGKLQDTIINFGETLPEDPLNNGFSNAKQADLCLVLGSSMTVNPASKIPASVGRSKKGKLVICNLQRTPYDDIASLRIHAKCDDLMLKVMKELGLEIPSWKLQNRILHVNSTRDSKTNQWKISLKSTDVDDTPSSYIRAISLSLPKEFYDRHKFYVNAEATQYNFDIQERPEWKKKEKEGEHTTAPMEVLIKLSFYQHYLEPDMQFVCKIPTSAQEGGFSAKYLLEYDPSYRKFSIFDWETKNNLSAAVGRGGGIMGNPDDEESEEKEGEEEREEELLLIKKLPSNNPLILRAAPVSNVSHVKDEIGKKSTLSGMRPRTVCIVNCKDCEYVIEGPSLKVVIEGCERVSVSVNGTVISGVVEVINSKNMKLQINKNVPTLQIDGTTDCQVEFEFDSFVENIYTQKSKGIQTGLKGCEVHNSECGDGSWEDDQYITRLLDGLWVTERVLRCAGGYVTTQGAMDEFAEKEKLFNAAMMKFVASSLSHN